MSELHIRPKQVYKYALVSPGEFKVRLNPNEGRVRTVRYFAVSEGGGD